MKKKENKYNFDLSNLSLKELIEVYENITNFLDYLENHKLPNQITVTDIRNMIEHHLENLLVTNNAH